MIYGGIDPSGSSLKNSGICLLDAECNIHFLGKWKRFKEIIQILKPYNKEIFSIGIDGPLKLPFELDRCCFQANQPVCQHTQTTTYKGRYCEYLLTKNGFPCFTTSKNSFVKEWILRCYDLNSYLQQFGYRTVEVFPAATKKILFPGVTGKKQLQKWRNILQMELVRFGVKRLKSRTLYSHDELDAVLAALTVHLYKQGKTVSLGNDREGYIIIPADLYF